MQADWELSQSFESDGQGVRVACVLPAAQEGGADAYRIVAGTQGGSLWEFGVPSGNLSPIDYQHNHAVTALIASPDNSIYVTGCKDYIIRVFDATTHAHLFSLEGHAKAVTSLNIIGDFLISGSWDGTAKVWNVKTRALVTTLEGHENTVSVVGLGQEGPLVHIATGSAGIAQNNSISNHSIRIFTVNTTTGEQKLVNKVSNDHDGPIRDLCVTSEGMLASCSNDGSVKLRSTDSGEALTTLVTLTNGEAPMLLSLASHSEYLASSAEDGHVFVFTGGDAPQVIRHASCVWSVTTVPSNGDLITCCQDGTLRIFTQASDRMAPEADRQAFATLVQEALQKQSSGPTQEELANMPKWELNALQQGKKEGEVKVFNKDGIAIAAQWSAASQTWIEVGQVMGSNQDAGMIDGVKYDHVLPIEVDTEGGGVAKLNIGYNNGENPFVAAQRFIDAHMLPQYHLAQIADYIQQRVGTQAPTLGMDTAASASVVPPTAMYKHVPVKGYKTFELGKPASLEKMQSKLVETGKLTDQQKEYLTSLIETLAATNRYHATKVNREEMIAVREMMLWSPAEAFPALDLARIMVLHPDASSRDKIDYWNEVIQLACGQCDQVNGAGGTEAVAIPMLSLRLFSNCFKGGPGSLEAVVANMSSVLDCAEKYVLSSNKNVRLSVATLLMNISAYVNEASNDAPEVSQQVVSMINKLIESKLYESEATTRALLALGTVVLAKEDARTAAKTLYLTTKVEPAASPHGDKAKAVAKEIYAILQ